MNKEKLIAAVADFVEKSSANVIDKSLAINPELEGLRIYDAPILGFADAKDPLFAKLKEPGVIGSGFMQPDEWLNSAASVVSFFLPFTDAVKKSNIAGLLDDTSPEWLHGRIEGQKLINQLSQFIKDLLKSEGFEAVSPAIDGGFKTFRDRDGMIFSSNWSERHVAYISGLGTFGLSKGLITEKGIAGRFGSVITSASFEAKERAYTGVYDNCTMCGACVKRCPVDAIDLKTGKDHVKCSDYMDVTMERYKPRYGCGKCQVGVPCQSGIPKKR